jgi:bleomycin hydrolase
MKHYLYLILFMAALVLAQKSETQTSFYRADKNFHGKADTILSLDFSTVNYPKPLTVYSPVYHTPPRCQDTTNTCWSFAATSLLETELHRLGRGDLRLSEMHTVYWEYVEKVRRFVQSGGQSLVAPGSQLNAVIRQMQKYGAVPADVYTGKLGKATIHDERAMLKEIETYLEYLKKNQLWNEDQAVANVRMILDRCLGPLPMSFLYKGNSYTPLEFSRSVLGLPLADYVSVVSFKSYPFWTQGSYPVPDNWWECKEYYNVPLDDFYLGIKTAIQHGYSVAIAGDVSEPGKYDPANIAIVPSFDIPAAYINQDSREFRFVNKSSTDDHGLHLIGYTSLQGQDWFLIKDSWGTAWRGNWPGYHFFHGDYLKLKILAYMVHKDAVAALLQKYEKLHKK